MVSNKELRREKNKQAILYEVVTEDTSEERTSDRRRGKTPQADQKPYPQLSIVPSEDTPVKPLKAAEKSAEYKLDED